MTKTEAIRMLVPHILGMRAKGYRLADIAKMLSDRGIPVSAAALQKHLSHVRRKRGQSKPRAPQERLAPVSPGVAVSNGEPAAPPATRAKHADPAPPGTPPERKGGS